MRRSRRGTRTRRPSTPSRTRVVLFASPTSMRCISSSSRRTWAAAARVSRHGTRSARARLARVRGGKLPCDAGTNSTQETVRTVPAPGCTCQHQHARLALGELEAPLRVDDDAWLLSERGQDRRLALDPHVLPMDEFRRNARIELLIRRSLRLTAKQERIASVIEANPASIVTVRVNGRERELTNHHEGTDVSVTARAVLDTLRGAALGVASSETAREELRGRGCQRTTAAGLILSGLRLSPYRAGHPKLH